MSELIEKEQNEFIKKLVGLRSQIDDCIRESYGLFWRDREYVQEAVIPAIGAIHLQFGVEHEIFGTAVLGLPETAEKRNGMERDFLLKHLVIEGDLDGIGVQHVFIGNMVLWGLSSVVPASKFSATVENKINIDRAVSEGLCVTATLQNTNDRERTIKMKLVGRERAPNPAVA